MSGFSTDQRFAILDAQRGINIDAFKSMTQLAEQAMRSAMWEMTPEEHVAWAERMVEMIRHHREVPAPANRTPVLGGAPWFYRDRFVRQPVAEPGTQNFPGSVIVAEIRETSPVPRDVAGNMMAAAPQLLELAFEFEAFAEAAVRDAHEEKSPQDAEVWLVRLAHARAAIAKASGSAA